MDANSTNPPEPTGRASAQDSAPDRRDITRAPSADDPDVDESSSVNDLEQFARAVGEITAATGLPGRHGVGRSDAARVLPCDKNISRC
jgi:hypothetical protein